MIHYSCSYCETFVRFGVNKSYGLPIDDHDYVFWFGDFNFRINLQYAEVCSKVFEQDWEYLLANDQVRPAPFPS